MSDFSPNEWWKKTVIYQIYPRSFKDSDDDGIGDLQGIRQKLDYLEELGVGAIWISPIFPSPMADFGYDVSDYTDIHPIFGTMEDFDELITEVHKRGMKLILDLVPNHTSDQHPWFLESRSSKDNPKRDWYIWKDPGPEGEEPNNWLAAFGGKAWEWDADTGQYYYHSFLKEQPDLNWRNPQVQEAVYNEMRFWLDKGVDGFRVDVMWHLIKDDQFRDNPPNPDYDESMSPYDAVLPVYSTDQAEVQDIVKQMRDVVDEYPERLLIGEIYLPLDKLVKYYGQNNDGAHLPFNFQLIFLPWEARALDQAINEYEASLPEDGWPNWVLGNHDNSRIATRVGKDQARVAAMLLLTLRGTPTLYYGDEIGMVDVEIPPHQVQDPQEKNIPGIGLGRDPERTPMQWDATDGAGFSSTVPWLPIGDHKAINVAEQIKNVDSIYSLYQRLISLRNSHPALQTGQYQPVYGSGNVLSYLRKDQNKTFFIVLNLGSKEEQLEPKLKDWRGIVVVATHKEAEGKRVEGKLRLEPDQGLLMEISYTET